jgi:hypothetical protein
MRAAGATNRPVRWRSGAVAAFAVGAVLGAASLFAAHPVLAQDNTNDRASFDIFQGTDKPGPYTLSWTNLRINRDEPIAIVIDGVDQKPDTYTIDPIKGTITFAQPLSSKSVARVSYFYDPMVAHRNANVASAPVTVPLTRLGSQSLQVTAVPNTAGPSGTANTPLIWNLGGKTNFLGGGLTSQFNYGGSQGSGEKLGYNVGNARNGLDAQFQRAEKQFAAGIGKTLGMGEAVDRWSVASRLTPTKWFGVSYNTTATDDLTNHGAKGQDVLALHVGGIGTAPLLAYNRTLDKTVTPLKQETNVTTDKVDLAAHLDRMTAVNVNATQAVTDTPQTAATDTTDREGTIALTSTSPDKLKQATVSLNTGSIETVASRQAKQNVAVKLQPDPVFIIGATQSSQKVTPVSPDGKTGAPQLTTVQAATAEIIPVKNAKVTTGVSDTTQNDVKTSAVDWNAQVGTGKPVEITTGVTNRSTEVAGASALDTTRAQIALRPLKTLTLTGGYTWNPVDNGNVRQALRQEVGLNAHVGALELGSGYSLTTLNGLPSADALDPQYGLVSLTVGLRLNKATLLSSTYKDSLLYRSAQGQAPSVVPPYLRVLGVGLSQNFGANMTWSLGGTMTDDRSKAPQDANDVKAEAKVGVHF